MSKLNKLRKVLSAVKAAHDALSILDENVDVDRLIAISNAQGPQAKLIKDVLSNLSSHMDEASSADVFQRSHVKKLPGKKK